MTREDAATTTAARRSAPVDEGDMAKLEGAMTTLRTSSETDNATKNQHFLKDGTVHHHQPYHPQQQQQQQQQQQKPLVTPAPQAAAITDEQEEQKEGEEEENAKEDCILFIGDLARGLSETDLERAFSSVGTVVMVDIKRDKVTMRNLGYGFVQMATREEAEAAKESMQDAEIQGRRIRLGWAQRNTALFVGDLDEATTVEELLSAFRPFGPLLEDQTYLRVGKFGKYGAVKFTTRHDAEAARREMNGVRLGDGPYPIRVVWHHAQTSSAGGSSSNSGGGGGGGPPSSSSFRQHSQALLHVPPPPPPGAPVSNHPYSVHVQFEADASQPMVSEGVLHSFFAPFGEVRAVILPQGPGILSAEGDCLNGACRRGYGFVHFSGSALGRHCAIDAIRTLQGQVLNGIRLKCAFSKKPGGPPRPGAGPAGPRGGGLAMRTTRGGGPLPNGLPPHAHMHLPPGPLGLPHDLYPQGGVPAIYMPMMEPGSPLGPMDGGAFDPKMGGGLLPGRTSPPGSGWMEGQPPAHPSAQQPLYPDPGSYGDEEGYDYPSYPPPPSQPGFYGQPSPHNYDMYHMPYYYSPPYAPPPSHHHPHYSPSMMGGLDDGCMGPPPSFPYSQQGMRNTDSHSGGGMPQGPDDHYHPHPGHGHHQPQQQLCPGEYVPMHGAEGFHRGACV